MRKQFASFHSRARASLVIAHVIGSVACSGIEADPASENMTEAVFEELRIRRGSFRERVLLTGTLEATRGVRITPPRTPTWQVQIRWMEEDGGNVTAGQKIVELDNSAFATDLESKHLAARKEEKELEQQKAQADAKAAELGFAVSQRRTELAKAEIEVDIPWSSSPFGITRKSSSPWSARELPWPRRKKSSRLTIERPSKIWRFCRSIYGRLVTKSASPRRPSPSWSSTRRAVAC